ncbi:MAG TPA: hypothetical protein PKG48_03475 [Bacteroidales bacterium]|nr:hypothetical protein [Bacteroidales bacterium]HPS61474.1 hypothetical protein [Bacteroidales bacterium]
MAFKDDVEEVGEIRDCYQTGLKALGSDSAKVRIRAPRDISGSVFLDQCLETVYPQAPRWDYLFCYRNEVFFMEVHPANTSEVRSIIAKLTWLKRWLAENGASINKRKARDHPYRWIGTNGVHITRNSRHHRLLIQAGVQFPQEVLIL